jgi:hypothetical protein
VTCTMLRPPMPQSRCGASTSRVITSGTNGALDARARTRDARGGFASSFRAR